MKKCLFVTSKYLVLGASIAGKITDELWLTFGARLELGLINKVFFRTLMYIFGDLLHLC